MHRYYYLMMIDQYQGTVELTRVFLRNPWSGYDTLTTLNQSCEKHLAALVYRYDYVQVVS